MQETSKGTDTNKAREALKEYMSVVKTNDPDRTLEKNLNDFIMKTMTWPLKPRASAKN